MTTRRFRKERCESGLIGTPGKRVWRQRHRGFESRPLRQSADKYVKNSFYHHYSASWTYPSDGVYESI